jgi:hypothetical protein
MSCWDGAYCRGSERFLASCSDVEMNRKPTYIIKTYIEQLNDLENNGLKWKYTTLRKFLWSTTSKITKIETTKLS